MSTNVHTIYLYPKDPLFFRDGRPFSMGEDTSANMLFPPMPSVFYGALRGLIAAHNGITDGETAKKMTEGVIIHSIDLLYSNQADVGSVVEAGNFAPLFSMPLDIIAFKNEKETQGLEFRQKQGLDSSFFKDYELKATEAEKTQDIEDYFLSSFSLTDYLNDNQTTFNLEETAINLNKHKISEPKIGIGRDKTTYTTSQGKLYRVPMLRTEYLDKNDTENTDWIRIAQLCFSISFSINQCDNLELPNSGFVKLGADSKLVRFTTDNTDSTINKPVFADDEQFFKLYLASPAIWNGDTDFAMPNLFAAEAELVAAAVGKAVYVGGFDMAENKPKAMQRAIPAGSVYYFKLKNAENAAQQLNEIVKNTHNKCISDHRAHEGFGRAFIGKVNT